MWGSFPESVCHSLPSGKRVRAQVRRMKKFTLGLRPQFQFSRQFVFRAGQTFIYGSLIELRGKM
jgi:hypothetical protein